jgi:hypothetical protein
MLEYGAPVMLSRFHQGLQMWIGLDLQMLSGFQAWVALPGAGGAGGVASPLGAGCDAGPAGAGAGEGVLREGAEEEAAGALEEAAGALEDERAEVAAGAAELTELAEPPTLMLAERSRGEEFFP